MSDISEFATLFEGRTDCYGSGGAPRCVKEPLTLSVWQRHLEDQDGIGVYPRRDDDYVHWGCSDIDKGFEALYLAQNLRKALGVLNLPSFVEQSRSKGYHVWVFLRPNVFVPAAHMRNAFLLAHHLADVPPVEVNPKQTHGGIGNYVRLPYPGRGIYGGGRIVLDMEHPQHAPFTLHQFLREAAIRAAHHGDIARASELYVERVAKPEVIVEIEEPSEEAAAFSGALNNVAGRVLFEDGPLPDPIKGKPDRSMGLARLAYKCAEAELTAGEALVVLRDANVRWGKAEQWGDRSEHELRKLVQRAYA